MHSNVVFCVYMKGGVEVSLFSIMIVDKVAKIHSARMHAFFGMYLRNFQ